MKLGGELKELQEDLAECIAEVKQVIAGLRGQRAYSEDGGRYTIRANGRGLAENIVMVSWCTGEQCVCRNRCIGFSVKMADNLCSRRD